MIKRKDFLITTIISIFIYSFLLLLLWFDKQLIGIKRILILIIIPIWAFSIIPAISYNINYLKQNEKTSEFVAYIIFYGFIWLLVSPYFMIKYYISYFKTHTIK